jgi:hypothetical protein
LTLTSHVITDLCVAEHRHDPGRPRTALDGLYLCGPCRDQLEALLAQLPGLYADLEDRLASGSTSTGPAVSGSASEPLPINTAVADHRHQIQHDLVWWCILVADERGIARPERDDPATTAAWLARHVDWCAGRRHAAEELLPVLRGLAGRARAIIDPDRKLPTGERCRTVGEDGERCDGAIVMRQAPDETWSARCPMCGQQEAADYLHDALAGRWVTIERVEAYVLRVHGLRVARATIRSWAARERVQARTEREATWYELGSVNRYLEEREREKVGA